MVLAMPDASGHQPKRDNPMHHPGQVIAGVHLGQHVSDDNVKEEPGEEVAVKQVEGGDGDCDESRFFEGVGPCSVTCPHVPPHYVMPSVEALQPRHLHKAEAG
jgi:hypothetical protein